MLSSIKIGIVGLGYVGLPLAVEFAKKYSTLGFDINQNRVSELNSFVDSTNEVESEDLSKVLNQNNDIGLTITDDKLYLEGCNVYIITVPTPIDTNKNPDLSPLINATKMVSQFLDKDNIVIYESTVYPGATEEECVPILEKISKLKYNKDFYCGYSPERINPGDKKHTLINIKKITSGSNKESAFFIDNLYKSIIVAGTYKAKSIKVAEAAKVIENCQRDINIAFVNELSKIFNLMQIDTNDVLDAASSKWNFLNFRPGIVCGHCIGVDPYYLAQKSINIGYYPEIILGGRRINDSMGSYISKSVIKKMIKKNIVINNSSILILGFTFKENCPDTRNTKVIDIYNELIEYNANVKVFDPIANKEQVKKEYDIDIINDVSKLTDKFDCAILSVSHNDFKNLDLKNIMNQNSLVYDVKNFYSRTLNYDRL